MASHLGTDLLYFCLLLKYFHKPFAWNVTTKVKLREKIEKISPKPLSALYAYICVAWFCISL